ncbi:MAG TPA: hypothetical protein VFH56_05135, partial [Acidimicrobiales bacterium]|nr:hypothetical protein [Acidimicrobiales bacterium]
MPTRIAPVAGVHPYFLGTDTPIGVDDAGTDWSISFTNKNAQLVATFAQGVTATFKIPANSITKSGSVAAFTIPNFGNATWTTYAQHVKLEVRFPAPPRVQTVSVNTAKQAADFVSDGNGGIDILSNGVKVGALPRPFLDYTPDGGTDTTRVWLNWVVADPTMSLTLPTLSASEWATAVLDPTVITTSTASTATAYSNQRKIDRTQNGVLWAMFWDGTSTTTTSMQFMYSTDNGATWVDPGSSSKFGFSGTGATYTPSGSLFIDLDDYAHVAYRDRTNGNIYYTRGTPNAGRTAYTWSSPLAVAVGTYYDLPDLIAHRDGSGWRVHVVWSLVNGSFNKARWGSISIAPGGAISADASVTANSNSGTDIGGSYSVAVNTYPSIDFNHTGDGKTVAGSTPHLYAAWSAGATGAGKGIRFKKATYSGGTWTWGTEVEIDNTSFANAGRISSAFDGSRYVIAYADSQATISIKVRERDAADTTTTTRTPTALSDGVVNGLTVSYKANSDIYLGAVGATSADPKVLVYSRSGGTWGAWGTLASTTAQADTLTSHRGGTSFVYTDGTANPYNVQYAKFSTGISVAINPALETDSPVTFGKIKRKALNPSSETDSPQTLGKVKRKLILPATETDLARAIGNGIRLTIKPAVETDGAQPITVTITPHPYVFSPPVHDEPMPTRVKPFCFFVQPVSFAVVMRNGHFQSVRTPSQEETDRLVEGETWFTGGRTYNVSGDTV